MDSITGANLLPDSYISDPCGTKVCAFRRNSDLALAYRTHSNRTHSLTVFKIPQFRDLSPESTKGDYSRIVYNNNQVCKVPVKEMILRKFASTGKQGTSVKEIFPPTKNY